MGFRAIPPPLQSNFLPAKRFLSTGAYASTADYWCFTLQGALFFEVSSGCQDAVEW